MICVNLAIFTSLLEGGGTVQGSHCKTRHCCSEDINEATTLITLRFKDSGLRERARRGWANHESKAGDRSLNLASIPLDA